MPELQRDLTRVERRLVSGLRRIHVTLPAILLFVLAGPVRAEESGALATELARAIENVASVDLESEADEEGCVESDTVICLLDGRYAVTLDWETADGETGAAKVAEPRTSDSGLFYFFDPTNWEVLVKVLNGCGTQIKSHWVYAAVASDVGMKLVVRDTTLPDHDADGRMLVNSRTYEFPPHRRRSQMSDESDEDYQANVLAKGHPALTASDAFPDACTS